MNPCSLVCGGRRALLLIALVSACSSTPEGGDLFGAPGVRTDAGGGDDGGSTGNSTGANNPNNSSTGGDAGPAHGDAGVQSDAGQTDGGQQVITDCVDVSVEPSLAKPVDIVWVIDNSGSMGDEAASVATNLLSFADALLASQLDYHLVVISREGFVPEYAQLEQTLPSDRFMFVNENVQSQDPLLDLVSVYPRYEVMLRDSAVLHFIAVTDDEAECLGTFDECTGLFEWLTGVEPWDDEQIAAAAREQFSRDMGELLGGRKYFFHAIASPDPRCDGAAAPGLSYYSLAEATSGETFEICNADWSGLFDQLGTAVDESAKVSCAVDIPEPPDGLALNPEQVTVDFSVGGMSETLTRVANASDCDAGGWYYDRPLLPQLIELCPDYCMQLQTDTTAKLEVTLACGSNACAGVSTAAEVFSTPVDIVWVIDSSGSMDDEHAKIEANLQAFADQITATGLDFRVFVVKSASSDLGVPDDARFFAIDVPIGSHDALQQSLNEYATISADMRADAITHFVFVSDDEAAPEAGAGSAAPEDVDATVDWFVAEMSGQSRLGKEFIAHAVASEDPTCSSDSNTAAAPGRVYYGLAGETGGTTFSICEDDWAALFDQLSTAVLISAPVECGFDMPEPPDGQIFPDDQVNVRFGYRGAAQATIVGKTSGPDACDAGGWYYDDPDDPSRIQLCPVTCDEIQSSNQPAIDIELGCETEVIEVQ